MRGGGGMSRPSPAAGRSPSISRPSPSVSRPSPNISRPNPNVSRPNPGISGGPRPSTGAVGGNRPNAPGGSRPGSISGNPSFNPGGAGSRPGSAFPGGGSGVAGGARPSAGQLDRFIDTPRPGGGQVVGGTAARGGAAADFLQQPGRPSQLPSRGSGALGAAGAAGIGAAVGAGAGIAANRPNAGAVVDRRADLASSRPERIDNRQQYRQNRADRVEQIHDEIHNTPIRDFWSDHPAWGAWAITRPYRWASWGAYSGWVGYGAVEPIYYNYGENVYYQDGSVYYGDQAVATAEEYATQAEQIVAAAPEAPSADAEWMPLGVFALTQDGQPTGTTPSVYMQLAVDKSGVLAGTLYDSGTNKTQQLEGMVDKKSQRAAWGVVGKQRPIIETGVYNLTQDSSPALLHFADGQTQQWLLVRLPDPSGESS